MTLALRRRSATSALTIEEALGPVAAALVAEAERRATEIGAATDEKLRSSPNPAKHAANHPTTRLGRAAGGGVWTAKNIGMKRLLRSQK